MMSDPVGLIGSQGAGAARPTALPHPQPQPGAPGFRDLLMQNLKEVNALEQDATRAVEDLQTGKRTDLEGVLLATQKADTAFKMLQAVRNKVIQAYDEIQQMRA